VNNTNWTTVLSRLIECRAVEFLQQTVIPRSTFNWFAIGGRGGIVTNGGACQMRVRNPNPFGLDWFHRVAVPRYDGPAQAAAITADATRIVNTMLAAGADKIVWMLYYDINPANIDIANTGWQHVRANAPGWIVGLLPPRINPNLQSLVDPMWVGSVRGLINDLNTAVRNGIPVNPKVRAQAPPFFVPGDIQTTTIGGSPHPSAQGHTKLANTLDATYRAM